MKLTSFDYGISVYVSGVESSCKKSFLIRLQANFLIFIPHP